MLKLLKLFWLVKGKTCVLTYWSYIIFTVCSTDMNIHVTLRICYMQFAIILRNKYSAWACLISLRLMSYLCCSLMSANQCKDNQFPMSTHLWNCGWNSTLPQHCSISPFIVSKCDWEAQFVWVKCRTRWGKTRERERKRDLLSFNISPFIKEGINRGEFSTAFQWGEVLSVKGLVWFKLAWETCDRFTWKAAQGLSVNNSLPVYFCLSRI